MLRFVLGALIDTLNTAFDALGTTVTIYSHSEKSHLESNNSVLEKCPEHKMNSESDLDLNSEDNNGGNYANYPWISKPERGLSERSRRHSSQSGRLNGSYKSYFELSHLGRK